MNAGKQEIQCSVDSCTHYHSRHCKLDSIMVGEACANPKTSEETICASFQVK